jgi:hypothetical protein
MRSWVRLFAEQRPDDGMAMAVGDHLAHDSPVVNVLHRLVTGADGELLSDHLRDRDLAALSNTTCHAAMMRGSGSAWTGPAIRNRRQIELRSPDRLAARYEQFKQAG